MVGAQHAARYASDVAHSCRVFAIVATSALLPADTEFGLQVGRQGPIRAEDFELWGQDPDNPFELIEGWVVPMSPGSFPAGELALRLGALLLPIADRHGWRISFDS